MNSKEICSILEASKGTGIKEIKIKDLTMKFDNLTKQTEHSNNSTKTVLHNSLSQVHEVGDIDIFDVKRDEREEEVRDEFTMANLMATDPEAFEEYQKGLMNG